MSHHYDDHDHDKLLRWRDDLQANAIIDGEFPAMALFLVKPQATGSHEIFRRFRTEFEQRDASFAHLVIFGMHGVSSTVRSLLDETGLSESDLPVMMLAPATEPASVIAVQLPLRRKSRGRRRSQRRRHLRLPRAVAGCSRPHPHHQARTPAPPDGCAGPQARWP